MPPVRTEGICAGGLVRSEQAGEDRSDNQHHREHPDNQHYLNYVPVNLFHSELLSRGILWQRILYRLQRS